MINFIGLYILVIFVLAGIGSRKNISDNLRKLDSCGTLMRCLLVIWLSYLTVIDIYAIYSDDPLLTGWTGFILGFPREFLIVGVLTWVHEGGHAALCWAGNFIHTLGGTLFQIGLPLSLTFICYIKRYRTAFSLGLWIVGISFLMSVLYIWDASKRVRPLLGGVSIEGHDWGNMLTTLGLLPYEKVIGYGFFSIGVSCEVLGIIGVFISQTHHLESDKE